MFGSIIGRCARALGLQKSLDFETQVQATHPTEETLQPGKIVVVRDVDIEKWVCFRCPCGCGEKIQLSLSKSRRPRWTVMTDWFGRASLTPSVRLTACCRAHFWLRRGQVEWCADSPVGHCDREQ